jgi:hypothetical protein
MLKDAALVYDALGESKDAVRVAGLEAIRGFNEIGQAVSEADAHEKVGEVAAALGRPNDAAEHRQHAESLRQNLRPW